ncbi:DUF2914 domain-containing protein [Agarivorans aestuarii]|uniref:DUF2914 domain-containing protein n=1 Tax=Agarivorans aestuarii TaxID=1563703 RepID=UPI001C7E4AEC|nr:DUF2914 domain-containing protein [Agarivorans aestuarii]
MAEQVSIKIHLNASASQTATIDKVPAPKPPFDLRKIFAAVLVVTLLVGGLVHFMWPAQAETVADSNATTSQPSSPIENTANKAQLPGAEVSAEHSSIAQIEQDQTLSTQSSAAVATEQQLQPLEVEVLEEPTVTAANTPAETTLIQPETNTVQPSQQLEELADSPMAAAAEQAEEASEQISQPASQANVVEEPTTDELEPSILETEASAKTVEAPTNLEQTSAVPTQVARAQLSSAISQREPVDNLSKVALSEIQQVYLFMELHEMQGQSIQVNWSHQGQLQASVDLDIGGPRWRTNASKRFTAQSRGEWQVTIVNQQQVRIFEQNFTVE